MPVQAPATSKNQVREAHKIVADLFEPRTDIFWSDLLISAAVGWSAFTFACVVNSFWQIVAGVAVCAIALYRALVFIHELSHIKPKALPGFALVWNLLIGIPLLLPAFVYTGVHSAHHGLASYGTAQDPEYMPFAGKRLAIFFFVVHSLLIPALLALRFLVLSPFGLLSPPLHRLLERHASSLTMNPAYCRRVSEQERTSMIITELSILGIWAIPVILVWQGILPGRIFVLWYAVMAGITLTNTIRTLGAHRYLSDGNSMDRDAQLLDSVDTPGGFWTVLWAPIGLRYHALHHFFPNLPYHNLPIAYQRLIQELPADSPYRRSLSPSLWHSLKTLWDDIAA